jgi:hypothetical protein
MFVIFKSFQILILMKIIKKGGKLLTVGQYFISNCIKRIYIKNLSIILLLRKNRTIIRLKLTII